MIQSKSDLVFVSRNAVKNITVTGAQYPLRSGKLALLGEDAAVLEEALLERRFYMGGVVNDEFFRSEFLLPEDHQIPEGSKRAGNSALQTLIKYDERIRIVRESVDDVYERIKGLLSGNRWADRRKLEALEPGEPSNPLVQCKGEEGRRASSGGQEESPDSPAGTGAEDPSGGSEEAGDGDGSVTAYAKAKASFDARLEEYGSDKAQLDAAFAEAIERLTRKYDSEVEQENASFRKSGSIKSINALYDKTVSKARSVHDAARESEDQAHAGRLRAIADRAYDDTSSGDGDQGDAGADDGSPQEGQETQPATGDGDQGGTGDVGADDGSPQEGQETPPATGDGSLSQDEIELLVLQENERHGFAVQRIDNKLAIALDDADRKKAKAVIQVTDRHLDRLKELKQQYDKDVAEETKRYRSRCANLLNSRDDDLVELCAGVPEMMDHIMPNSGSGTVYSRKWREHDEAFRKAVIRKSCADRFYARNPLFKPSSTAINRLYADLERMDDLVDPAIELWREACTYTYNGTERQLTLPHLADREVVFIDPADADASYDNYDFFFFYGHRYELSRVDRILADAVLYREDRQDRSHERSAALGAGMDRARDAMTGVSDHRWRFNEGTYNGIYFVRVDLFDTDGMSAAELEEVQDKLYSANTILAEAVREMNGIGDFVNRAYSVSRVEFKLDSVPNEDEYSALDSLSDELVAERNRLVKDRDRDLEGSRLLYEQRVKSARETYDRTVSSAAKKLAKSKEQANADYVRGLWEVSMGVNTVLASEDEPDDRKESALNAFASRAAADNEARQARERQAELAYETAVESATKTLNDAVDQASRERTRREEGDEEGEGGINSVYIEEERKLKERLSRQAQAVYDAHAAKKNELADARAEAISSAAAALDDLRRSLVQGADEMMRSEFGPPNSDLSYANTGYGWDWATMYSGNSYIEVGEYEVGRIVERANEINGNIVQAQNEALEAYRRAGWNAETEYRSGISAIFDIQPNARGKFKASLVPADSCGLSGGEVSQQVVLIGLKNIEVRYKPRSATGAEAAGFSDYYDELDREEQEGQEEQETPPATGDDTPSPDDGQDGTGDAGAGDGSPQEAS